MNAPAQIFLLALYCLATCAACNTVRPHATEAELLVTRAASPQSFEVAFAEPITGVRSWAGGNPVEVYTDSKFVLSIDHIHAGWLHNDWRNLRQAEPGGLPAWRRAHFRGKELWLLTTIRSLDPADPLEVNSKLYVKATNVKFDTGSFSFVPLDAAERDVFTHDSDKSYRIRFQLFEVDGFALKRELVRVAQSPGIAGAAQDLLLTLQGTAGALAGDIVKNMFDRWREEPLAFERLLLTLGATEEFRGEILLVRKGQHPASNLDLDSSDARNLEESRYVLVDPFKESELHTDSVGPAHLSGPQAFLQHKNEVLSLAKCWGYSRSVADADDEANPPPAPGSADCKGLLDRTFLGFTVAQVPAQDPEKKKTLQEDRQKLARQESDIAALQKPPSGEKVSGDSVAKLKILAATVPADRREQIGDAVTELERLVNARERLLAGISSLEAGIATDRGELEQLLAIKPGAQADDVTGNAMDAIQALTDSIAADESTRTDKLAQLTDRNQKIFSLAGAVIAALKEQRSGLQDDAKLLSRLLDIQSRPYD